MSLRRSSRARRFISRTKAVREPAMRAASVAAASLALASSRPRRRSATVRRSPARRPITDSTASPRYRVAVTVWPRRMRSSVSSAVMSFVVLAIERRSRALRDQTMSPVAGSTRIPAGARTVGAAAAAGAGRAAPRASTMTSAASAVTAPAA